MKLLITEKPSVAMEFAKVLKLNTARKNGYIEDKEWIITWCVGHLVTMSYPEKYDEKLKFWRLEDLPFLPKEYKYEVIPAVEKQFNIVNFVFDFSKDSILFFTHKSIARFTFSINILLPATIMSIFLLFFISSSNNLKFFLILFMLAFFQSIFCILSFVSKFNPIFSKIFSMFSCSSFVRFTL